MTAAMLALLLATAAPLEPCNLETPGLGRTHAKCGSVVVDGVTIGFAVLPARNEKRKEDPIVFLPGGPGQAATELAAIAAQALSPARRDRDIVLFDPRGTGRSHKLSCNDDRALVDKLTETEAQQATHMKACARGLDLDPTKITTQQIAADLEAVRTALDVTTWNLIGVSYGTRLALAYDRAYPGRARTLTLDSVVPFSMIVGETATRDAEAALAALDARVATATPPRSLADIMRALRVKLDAAPAPVVMDDPTTGKRTTLPLDGKTAAAVVKELLYAEEGAAILPPLLRAADAGDYRPLAAQLVLAQKLEGTIAQPMQLSVLCAEDVPFYTSKPLPPDAVFPDFREEMKTACASWPHAETPLTFHFDLPASPTPALLLSGSADPITPPRFADQAAETLTNSVQVVGAGLGHNLLFRGCVPDFVKRFVDSANPKTLDTTCAKRLGPFPVFVDALGPAP